LITYESVSVAASEPGLVTVHYAQLDDGLDMGGRLCIERQSVPAVVELLHACLNVYGFPATARRCGHDNFRVYESGPEQRPFYNIFNRRPEGVPHGGLSGLMLTRAAAEELLARLPAFS
jgi:hypothetical protein